MKVILLDKIARLGTVGQEVEVKAGYARNYLLPKKFAVLATKDNRAKFEAQRAQFEAEAAAKLAKARELEAKIVELGTLEIGVDAGTEGRLFGAVTNRTLAEVLEAYDIKLDKSAIRVPGTVIREIGEHTVNIHLHSEVNAELKVYVYAA